MTYNIKISVRKIEDGHYHNQINGIEFQLEEKDQLCEINKPLLKILWDAMTVLETIHSFEKSDDDEYWEKLFKKEEWHK